MRKQIAKLIFRLIIVLDRAAKKICNEYSAAYTVFSADEEKVRISFFRPISGPNAGTNEGGAMYHHQWYETVASVDDEIRKATARKDGVNK